MIRDGVDGLSGGARAGRDEGGSLAQNKVSAFLKRLFRARFFDRRQADADDVVVG
jgi:hypothetical protein